MSEIKHIAGMEFDKLLLQQMHLGELDVVNSRINQQLDMSRNCWVLSRLQRMMY